MRSVLGFLAINALFAALGVVSLGLALLCMLLARETMPAAFALFLYAPLGLVCIGVTLWSAKRIIARIGRFLNRRTFVRSQGRDPA